MKSTARTKALRKLLDACDDLHRIRDRMTDPELRRDARAKLRRRAQRKSEQLTRDLSAYRFHGPLGRVMREYRFTAQDFEVLAILLHRSMRFEDPATEGRTILASMFETSFDVLAGMELLHATARLRNSGLVVLAEDEEDDGGDVLSARFRLSDDALDAFREEIQGLVPEDLRRSRIVAYSNHRELLVDLRTLHNLFQTRAERVFHPDRWDRIRAGGSSAGQSLERRIESFWERIQKRLAATEDAARFPSVGLMRNLKVTREELVAIVHLLFRELYEGNAYADAAELIRLISRDETELIRNRSLVRADSRMLRGDIFQLETTLESRELTGEVHLSDWVVNLMFELEPVDGDIQSDEKLDWHLYLRGLDDSGRFFRDLEAG